MHGARGLVDAQFHVIDEAEERRAECRTEVRGFVSDQCLRSDRTKRRSERGPRRLDISSHPQRLDVMRRVRSLLTRDAVGRSGAGEEAPIHES